MCLEASPIGAETKYQNRAFAQAQHTNEHSFQPVSNCGTTSEAAGMNGRLGEIIQNDVVGICIKSMGSTG